VKELEHLVRRARRRLWLNRWLALAGWTVTGAAGVFLVAVVVQRVWMLSEAPGGFYTLFAAAALAGACAAACVWTWVTRESFLTAAAHLDVAAGLKERVSTALYCAAGKTAPQADPFAQAVVTDAKRASGQVDPRASLPIRWPSSARWAGGMVLAAVLVLGLFPEIDLGGLSGERHAQQQQAEAVQRTEAEVRPLLASTYESLARTLPEMGTELAEADPLKNARLDSPLEVRRTAMKQVDRLAEQLQRRRDEDAMARVEEFKRMMRRLAGQATKPTEAGRLADALARGDLGSARSTLNEIAKKLAATPQSDQEQEKLEELQAQLRELADKLAELAANDGKIAERLRAEGLSEEEIQKALESIERQDLEALERQLAERGLSDEQVRQLVQQVNCRLGACEGACGLAQGLGMLNSEGLSAADALLSEMESLESRLARMNSALADLEATRARLGSSCTACNGTGKCKGGGVCSACGGTGLGVGRGIGLGAGPKREGTPPAQQETFNTVQHRAITPINRSGIIMQRFIDGEQYKGEVTAEFVETALSAERDVTDAIARERIPRVYHGPVRNYFTRFRESLPADATEQPAPEEQGP